MSRATIALLTGAGIVLLAHYWARPTAWMLTRIQPETPVGHQPRYRAWINHMESEVTEATWPRTPAYECASCGDIYNSPRAALMCEDADIAADQEERRRSTR